MSRGSELDPLVNQFQHESHRRRAADALQMLMKVASIVKPIMRQRNWVVGTLAEFWPDEQNLLGLNINHGQKICLRLRYPGDQDQFLPLENVVDTMLHELCHNVIGPHNAEFHALWDKLRDEHEALIRKGYTGEGFLGHGNRLGGARIPVSEAKRRARAAAEKRRTLTAGSGQKLGGMGIMRGQNPRAIIAAAAERRMRIQRGCASNTEQGRQVARNEEIKKEAVTTTQAEEDDPNEHAIMQAYIDLIQEEEMERMGDAYLPPSQDQPAGVLAQNGGPSPTSLVSQQANIEQTIRSREVSATRTQARTTSSVGEEVRSKPAEAAALPPPETWTCDICTLVNPILFLTCDACGTDRPSVYAPQPSSPTSGPNSRSSPRPTNGSAINRDTPSALKPRLNVADSLAKLDAQAAYKRAQPVGWKCFCGNWMEQEWWTCSVCGRMKAAS